MYNTIYTLPDFKFIGYIYKITIPTSKGNRYYFGMKKATKIIWNYWGSGTKLKKWVFSKTQGKIKNTYSMSNKVAKELGLKREILAYATSLDELYRLEYETIKPHLGKEYCWNLIEGGKCTITLGMLGKHHSEETKQKLSLLKKGKHLSEEAKHKISIMNKGRISPKGMLGKKQSKESIEKALKTKLEKYGSFKLKEETIEKIKKAKEHISKDTRKRMSESAKKRIHTKASEETKQKLSQSKIGNKNPAFGKKWWTNGIEQIYAKNSPGKDWINKRLYRKKN